MRRSWMLVLVALTFACGGVKTSDTVGALVIDDLLSLSWDPASRTCSPGGPLGAGFYDAGWGFRGQGYLVFIQLENQSRKDVLLQAVHVTLEASAPWDFLPGGPQEILLPGKVPSGGSLSLPITLLSPSQARLMLSGSDSRPSPIAEAMDSFPLVVHARAQGSLVDGTKVESNEIGFQVAIGNRTLGPQVCPDGQVPAGCTLAVLDTNLGTLVPVQSDGWSCLAQ